MQEIRPIFSRFFPKKFVAAKLPTFDFHAMSEDQKKEYALQHLIQGESLLLKGDLKALAKFEAAVLLDSKNPSIWFRQGLAFFEYGSIEGKERALLVASKNFKTAVQLNSQFFDAWMAWGHVLFQLGKFHEEHHFFLEAREKLQKALLLAENQPKDILAELYWDYGLVWSEIAQNSGEAIDVRLAIQAFQTALTYFDRPTPEFFHDVGNGYLQMGLLTNDARLYYQAVEYLRHAVNAQPHYLEGWSSLAEAYSQLYINTMDENQCKNASGCYAKALQMAPRDVDLWLGWAQILGESGKLNSDAKKLRLSIERSSRALSLSPRDPLCIAQWVESTSCLGALLSRLDLLIEAEDKIIKATDVYSEDPDLWYAYGACLSSMGEYYSDSEYFDLAIEKFQFGLSIDRSDAELWQALAHAHKHFAELTDDVEMVERSTRFYLRAIDLKPACPALMFEAANAFFLLSEFEGYSHHIDQALNLYESLLHTYKEAILHHPEWLFQYGASLEWMGDISGNDLHLSRAVEVFYQVLLLDPDYPKIHYRIGLCYMQLGHSVMDAEYYRRALNYFRLGARFDEEDENLWLEWGICLIHLAHHTLDDDFMNQLYASAEKKISKAGCLGNSQAYYHLACLYSITGRFAEGMELMHKANRLRALPSIDELIEDEWLDNLRSTPDFSQFLTSLEARHQYREE